MANCRAMVRASGIVLWVSSRSSKIMRTYTTFSPQIMGSQVVGMAGHNCILILLPRGAAMDFCENLFNFYRIPPLNLLLKTM
jgi:hypothetical protein